MNGSHTMTEGECCRMEFDGGYVCVRDNEGLLSSTNEESDETNGK